MKHETATVQSKFASAPARARWCPGKVFLVVLAVLSVLGCTNGLSESGNTGELSINIGMIESGGAGVNPASFSPGAYLFTGAGPRDRTFSVTTTDGSVTIPSLAAGDWVVQATVFNIDGIAVLTGEATVTVNPGTVNKLTMALNVVEGVGSLHVDLGWNGASTAAPYAELQLVSANGASATYPIPEQSSGFATRLISDLPSGLYTYSIVLVDSGLPVMGRADTVRILAGVTSVVSYEFTEINKAGVAIPISASEFTVGWNPPDSGTPEYYRLHYRVRGTYTWHALVDSSAQPEPRFTITQGVLPYGTYELAVSSISEARESALHTSMSDAAEPGTGWYVVWNES